MFPVSMAAIPGVDCTLHGQQGATDHGTSANPVASSPVAGLVYNAATSRYPAAPPAAVPNTPVKVGLPPSQKWLPNLTSPW